MDLVGSDPRIDKTNMRHQSARNQAWYNSPLHRRPQGYTPGIGIRTGSKRNRHTSSWDCSGSQQLRGFDMLHSGPRRRGGDGEPRSYLIPKMSITSRQVSRPKASSKSRRITLRAHLGSLKLSSSLASPFGVNLLCRTCSGGRSAASRPGSVDRPVGSTDRLGGSRKEIMHGGTVEKTLANRT